MDSSKSSGYLREQRVGLGVSVALHLLLFAVMVRPPAPRLPESTVIDVTFEPRQSPAPKQQIVSPPNVPSEKPPERTDRISDVDATALKEQVKRGTEGGLPGQPSAPSEQTSQPSKEAPAKQQPAQPETQHPSPPLKTSPKTPPLKQPSSTSSSIRNHEMNVKDLKLDDATLALKFGAPPQNPSTSHGATPQNAADITASDLSKYSAFSRPPGSGATFVGSGGVSDHLPNLPDGDITLLNAKANTYAGFVRRVAVQVFAQLRSQGWEKLTMSEVRRIGDFTTIEAILSPDGKFISAHLIESSGSPSFDSVVQLAASTGTRDPNPPAGARAQDGKIHFIFKARSWASVGVNGRSGGQVEHRWLLLATGLE